MITSINYSEWGALESTLRAVGLRGDASVHPYEQAEIRLHTFSLGDIRPASYYVLSEQLDYHHKFEAELLQHRLSLLGLNGLLELDRNGELHRVAPPIVETYFESTENRIISVLVDGLHRAYMARKKKGTQASLQAVEISRVPAQFPLVPLPLQWEDVKLVASVEQVQDKRRFRFPTLDSFPDISTFSNVPVTEDNYKYFFYRDLSALGSSGVR